MNEAMMSLCELYNPPLKRLLDHAVSTDGYRLHFNPDGSVVYLEGYPPPKNYFLGLKASEAIDRCCTRMGLDCPKLPVPLRWYLKSLPSNHPLNKLMRLRRIMRLEHKFCGEEDW